VATVAAFLYTLAAQSANGVDKVYRQLKDILGTVTAQQAESSLQRMVEVLILRLSEKPSGQFLGLIVMSH
jgi:hypothetical protein